MKSKTVQRIKSSKKSEIYGQGYGDSHIWKRGESNQVGSAYWLKGTRYICTVCGVHFEHKYDLIPDIFEAIKESRIPDKCSLT